MNSTLDIRAASASGLDADALGRLVASIQVDIDQGQMFGASVIVARGGVVGLRQHIGTVAPGRPAVDSDLYLLMSLSKSFTAALTLRAIDRGRYALDTRVADIIPAFGAGGKARITIRHLLTHTAGMYNSFAPPPPLTPQELGNLAKNALAVSALPATHVPGARVVYSPFAAYAVLGQILVATDPDKRSFQQITHEDLFVPLGMLHTRYGLRADDPRRVPVSFTDCNATSASWPTCELLNSALDEHAEHPAGGAFGTVDDVFRFAETLRRRGSNGSHRLISPALFDYASQNHTGEMSNGAWDWYREAHGLPDFPANFSLLGGYVRGVGHHFNGAGYTASPRAFYAVGGGSTMWMVDPERDLTFIFLSAGFIEGLAHVDRLRRLGDLALAACTD
jgi:CubicO group peptidase (beta-lactamase class C family)